ncbi:unnamed protein product [Ambrosiozyma monospora]|uniref:Unnamed protein product n=1 Tax=Ambrosiozyma monospora TaxID=43982 RepID=A0ACB5TKI7_AMBMO|nr:unnamed protein product [Ambrosiozyma monospora]
MLILNRIIDTILVSLSCVPKITDLPSSPAEPISNDQQQQQQFQQPLLLNNDQETTKHHLPLVIWHGMGDSYNSSSMQSVESLLHDYIPDLFIHSIYIEENSRKDAEASIIGDVMEQTLQVCDQLNDIPELQNEGGFNAIGFSQGGLFLRGAIEVCGLNVKNLITYGSPHQGFTDLPKCDDGDWFCQKKNAFLKRQMYKPNIQNSVVQAQYFRDVENFNQYIESSNYLKFVNNEFVKDINYYDNFSKLEKFVMVLFLKDETLVPKHSAWFFDTDPTTGELIKLEDTESYKNDLIGLKKLHDQKKIEFLAVNGEHMEIPADNLRLIAHDYL